VQQLLWHAAQYIDDVLAIVLMRKFIGVATALSFAYRLGASLDASCNYMFVKQSANLADHQLDASSCIVHIACVLLLLVVCTAGDQLPHECQHHV